MSQNESHSNFSPENVLLDMDIEATKDFGFAATNKQRVEAGLPPYTKEEYDESFLEMHREGIKSKERTIEHFTKEMERKKEQLSSREQTLDHMKGQLSLAIQNDWTKLIEDWQAQIIEWEKVLDEDKLLEEISSCKKHIEMLNESIKKSKIILDRIEKSGENK